MDERRTARQGRGETEDLPAEVDVVGQADPTLTTPPSIGGGIGGTNDGTQVAHQVPTPIPGKPMAPIAGDPTDSTSFEGQAQDTPVSAPHSERGGTG